MQTLCLSPRSPARLQAIVARAASAWALAALSLPAALAATPGGPQSGAAAAEALVPWPSISNPEQALATVVTGWLASRTGTPAAGLQLAPLDPRLQLRHCPAGVRLDLPFGGRETVRVRCGDPAWQLHLRVLGVKPAAPTVEEPGATAAEPAPPRTRKVLVANALVQRGTRLDAEQLSVAELPAVGLPANVLENVNDVVNAEAVRDILAGTPLRSHDIRPALMVKKGQMVLLSAGHGKGFQVQARVEALQDGRMGEQIRLRSRESGRELSGLVTGASTAQAL